MAMRLIELALNFYAEKQRTENALREKMQHPTKMSPLQTQTNETRATKEPTSSTNSCHSLPSYSAYIPSYYVAFI